MSSSSESSFDEPEECSVANVAVLNKYKVAGKIADKVAQRVVERCAAGHSVRELCEEADKMIVWLTSSIETGDLRKGVAFPACMSVNNCVCHFSPLENDTDVKLKNGDLIKIDLAVHIDGYIACVGYSHVVGATKKKPASGRKADVVRAAYAALDASMRLIKAGVDNFKVTEVIQKAAEAFQCKPIEGMLSHQLGRNQFEGGKSIILNPNSAQKREHEKSEFAVNEVYALDILVSTGEGKAQEATARTTIHHLNDLAYPLRMKKPVKDFLEQTSEQYGTLCFHLRNVRNHKAARPVIAECVSHGLLTPFPVGYEKDGALVAQFKCTLAVTANGIRLIAGGLPLDMNSYKSDHNIADAGLKGAADGKKPASSWRGRPKKGETFPIEMFKATLPSPKPRGKRYSFAERTETAALVRQYRGSMQWVANYLGVAIRTIKRWIKIKLPIE
ncbi:proliferation-associated protein 2G4-like [Paramacrobiotus metropolitanus]|uniref:proliferation-associated protein 2G4-like n=1 Tax=Paramacrobiotus metropolitanus TaxID=2943436 RepID=UPI0024460ECA|nr:proliferation-associated protein 2G4-like [Paramacrobiotus metropolitanus]